MKESNTVLLLAKIQNNPSKNCLVFFDSMRVKEDGKGKNKSSYTLWDYFINCKFIISSTVDRLLRIYDTSDTCKDEDGSGIDDDFE